MPPVSLWMAVRVPASHTFVLFSMPALVASEASGSSLSEYDNLRSGGSAELKYKRVLGLPEHRESVPITPSFSTSDMSCNSDDGYANAVKTYLQTRLLERYTCTTIGHTYCAVDRRGEHVPIAPSHIQTWASACYSGEADIFCLPHMTMTEAPCNSDASSNPSMRSNYSFTGSQTSLLSPSMNLTPTSWTKGKMALYSKLQRVRKTSSPNVTRSIVTLHGLGSVYGNLIQTVGKHIIGMFISSEIIYRLWLVRQLLRVLERDQRNRINFGIRGIVSGSPNQYDRRVEGYHEAVKDLLELSKTRYGDRWQKQVSELASRLVWCTYDILGTSAVLAIDSAALRMTAYHSCEKETRTFDCIRDIITSDDYKSNDPEFGARILSRVSRELGQVAPAAIADWHCGATFLSHLCEGKNGWDLVAAFDAYGGGVSQFLQPFLEIPPPSKWSANHLSGLRMILIVADAVHKLRHSLLEPAGIPWVFSILSSSDNRRKDKHVRKCWIFLFELSQSEWGVHLMIKSSLSADFFQLKCNRSWDPLCHTPWYQLCVLRNIASQGVARGQEIVRLALDDHPLDVLYQMMLSTHGKWSDNMKEQASRYFAEIESYARS